MSSGQAAKEWKGMFGCSAVLFLTVIWYVGVIVVQNKLIKKGMEKGVSSSEKYEFSSQNVWIYELKNVETYKKKWKNY